MKNRTLKFVLILMLFLGQLKAAEDNNAAMQAYIQQQQQTIQNMQNKMNQSQGEDRADKSEKASAASIMGAAMAGMSCMMLMKKAMEEEDPEMKQMYMMMAMQQCQQAAQDKDSGKKNDDSKNQLTQNEVPQVPDFSTKETPKENTTPTLPTLAATEDTSTNTADLPEIPPLDVPQKDGNIGSTVDEGVSQDMISRVGSTIDEANRGLASVGSPSAPGNAGGIGSVFGFSNPNSATAKDEAAKKAALEGAAPISQRGVKADGAGGDAGGGGGESGSGGSKGDGGLDSMFSQMLSGGAPPADAGGFQGAGSDIIGFAKADAKNAPNIFEYASFRYKNLTYQEGKVVPKKTKLALGK